MHQALTVPILEDRLKEECPQLRLEAQLPEPETPHQPLPKKMTRQQTIKQLLHQQTIQPPTAKQHEIAETAGYLRCVKCGTNVHKRSNEGTFQAFVTGQCMDMPYTHPHEGHSSHMLWQKGTKVSCTQCGLSLHLDGQHRVILTAAFKKSCKGAAQVGTPPLTDFFARQRTQGTSADKHSSSTSSGAPDGPTKPTPRRLHFATQLTQAEDNTESAQAMNSSLEAGMKRTCHSTPSFGLGQTKPDAVPTQDAPLTEPLTREHWQDAGHDTQPPSGPQQQEQQGPQLITPNAAKRHRTHGVENQSPQQLQATQLEDPLALESSESSATPEPEIDVDFF